MIFLHQVLVIIQATFGEVFGVQNLSLREGIIGVLAHVGQFEIISGFKNGMVVHQPLQLSYMVENLNVSNVKHWNMQLCMIFFSLALLIKSCACLCFLLFKMTLCCLEVWEDGAYSVRSVYHFCVNQTAFAEHHQIACNWRIIWKAKIPPKVKNFIWRVGHNCIPTRVKLSRRGV
jgi:hypothetical protein